MDDAALSVGGTIAHRSIRGCATDVVTVFAGINPELVSPTADQFHRECGLGRNAVTARRREDATAMSILGASPHYLHYLDAIYRRNPDGEWLCQHRRQMFELPVAREQSLVTDVAVSLAELAARVQPDLVLTCAGFGNHIDHAVARKAAELWAAREGVQLLIWEDLPYAFSQKPGISWPGRPIPSMPPSEAWQRKWDAIRAYPSQISMLWPSEQTWQDKFAWHARKLGRGRPAELLWAKDPNGRVT